MGSSSSPPAPDYVGQAQATAEGNLTNLKYQTTANRPTIVTPWGQQSWSTADPTTGAQTETITLSPDQQAALDSQLAVGKNQSQLAQGMQGQVASTMAGGFNAPQYSTSGVNGVGMNYRGFNPNGTGHQNLDANGAVAGAGSQNLNTPQFSDANAQAGAQAAYAAQVGLLQPQMQQDTTNLDAKLRLQGLTPGTEAYNNAAQNLSRTQGQVLSQAANQAVLTGNQEANTNYASALAGYNAGNSAQNTAYSQGANTYTLGNTAQNTGYTQALQGYNASVGALNDYNLAQNQQYNQNLQNYNTNYNAAYQNYMTPLNSMNAVLHGNQVSMPNFGSYSQSGYVGGADLTTAAQNAGQYNSAQAAAQNASDAQTTSTIAGVGSAALMAAAMY